ncbi:TPA: hypothetical protein TY768_001270 [Streptococcus suis]|nr:hypothetical protein [Streptococcus suis]
MSQTIVEELRTFRKLIIEFEQATRENEVAQLKVKEAKNYQPKRLAGFDDTYLTKFVVDRIGEAPTPFGPLDLRRLSKRAVAKRDAAIRRYNEKLEQVKQEYNHLYHDKRQEFQRLDQEEKTGKLSFAEKQLYKTSQVLAEVTRKVESVNLLPPSLYSCHAIDRLITYFEDWRADTLKEAINLYFDESWRQDESQRLQRSFEALAQQMKGNEEQVSEVLKLVRETRDTMFEVRSKVDDIDYSIYQLKNE